MEKRKHFTPEQKAKIVIEVIKGERTLNEIAAEYGIHPNLLSRWKTEFISNAGRVFSKETDEVEKVKRPCQENFAKSIYAVSLPVASWQNVVASVPSGIGAPC
jgi:transposase-like protein